MRSASHHQLKYGRSRSPGLPAPTEPMFTDLSRVYTSTYLADESKYLKKPIEPKPPKSPQFHRPSASSANRARSTSRGRYYPDKPKAGMQVMVESLQSTSSSRPKSPHMNNEEPIELSHYPDARKPKPNEKARIERDDFPAPPYPYADQTEKKRTRMSSEGTSSRPDSAASQHRSASRSELDVDTRLSRDDGFPVDDEEEDEEPESLSFYEDPQLKKEEEELSKIATGIGKVFLKEIKEREKLRAWKMSHQDPRNASRNPSAKVELPKRLRYDNPVNASPSRDADRPRPWDDDADSDMASVFRSSGGKTAYTSTVNYNVVSSLRSVPRPGYGVRSMTPGVTSRSMSPFSQRSQPLPKLHSTDFSSARSDFSMRSDQRTPSHPDMSQPLRGATPYSETTGGYQYYSRTGPSSVTGGTNVYQRSQSSASYAAHLRRSMPNVNFHLHTNEPAKLYPYHLLMTSNYRLPPQVDRCHLEVSFTLCDICLITHVSI